MKDPIFIIGMARTGTTLMARILKQSGVVYVLNETHFMRECEALLDGNNRFVDEDPARLRKLVNLFLTIQRKDYYRKTEYQEYPEEADSILEAYFSKKGRDFAWFLHCFFAHECKTVNRLWPGDQTPNHVFYVKRIVALFPKAKFINMVRDPRAVILSQKNKWRAGKRKGQPTFEVLRTWVNYHPVTQTMYWNKAVDAGIKADAEIGTDNFVTVRFEDLVTNPEPTMRSVCRFLKLKFDAGMISVPVSMSSNILGFQGNGLDPQVIAKWKEMLSNTEVFMVEKVAGQRLQKLEYQVQEPVPQILSLLAFLIVLPIQVFCTVLINLNRIPNPIKYLRQIT